MIKGVAEKLNLTWILIGLLLAVVIALAYNFLDKPHQSQDLPKESTLEAAVINAMSSSEPIKIKIPLLNIEAEFEEPLGVNDNREIEVPESYTKVGWYKFGPTPGEIGPAVILGHVDSYKGPAVFFSLGQLNKGDEILIERKDGSEAKFVVEELERPKQSEFPTARVYGDLDYPGLRLITCSGIYQRGSQRYTHNLIVYARLVE